jgi:prepilin-type N-terminal cleavage/methylation domain-containing protein
LPEKTVKGILGALITTGNSAGRGVATRSVGFTLVEVMIVVTLVGLLAGMAIPTFLRSRNAAYKSTCINNLKQIDSAIQQWATECKKPQSASVDFSDISPYLKGAVVCPSGGTSFLDSYSLSTVADLPVCQKDPRNHVWLGPATDVAARQSD